VESDGRMFCCANCARHVGITEMVDRSAADAAP